MDSPNNGLEVTKAESYKMSFKLNLVQAHIEERTSSADFGRSMCRAEGDVKQIHGEYSRYVQERAFD